MALLAACAETPVLETPPPPTVVTIAASAAAVLNPDSSGRPSPASLRVYQLNDATVFAKADLLDLWDREALTLAATLVARHELTVAPGGQAADSVELAPETRRIGIAVAFRDFRNAAWRTVLPVPDPGSRPPGMTLLIKLDDKSVTAQLQALDLQAHGATN